MVILAVCLTMVAVLWSGADTSKRDPLMRSDQASRWRPAPARLARLLLGLAIFGAGEAVLVASALGNSPWTVLAEGLGERTAIGVGAATVALSVVVLALWLPLRQRPGLGTVLNALLVGVALGVVLDLVSTPEDLVWRAAYVLAGIVLVGLGSGLYLGARLGAGPRDGLMLGLHQRTGASIRLARTGVEVTVVAAGTLLGGTAGIGTLAFALLVGPAVQASIALLRDDVASRRTVCSMARPPATVRRISGRHPMHRSAGRRRPWRGSVR